MSQNTFITACLLFVLPLLATDAVAQEAELAAFARQNVGKFQSEVPDLPREFTLRSKPTDEWWRLGASYDQVGGRLIKSFGLRLMEVIVSSKCTPQGSYTASNAFGVKARVRKESCTELSVQDIRPAGHMFGDLDCSFSERVNPRRSAEEKRRECLMLNRRSIELPMSPSEYRALMKSGAIYEVRFVVDRDVPKEVATVQILESTPTIDSPVESTVQATRVHGRLQTLRIISSDGRTVLGTYERE